MILSTYFAAPSRIFTYLDRTKRKRSGTPLENFEIHRNLKTPLRRTWKILMKI